MTSTELCKYLKCTISQLRELQKALGIKGEGCGTVKHYTKEEQARLKAGVAFKNYTFVQDIDRFWIWYALSDTNEKTIIL